MYVYKVLCSTIFDLTIFNNSLCSVYYLYVVLSVDIKMEDTAGVVRLGMPCKFMRLRIMLMNSFVIML